MSTPPSPNDGNTEDFYRGGVNPNLPPPQIQQYVPSAGHPHQAQPPPPQFVHWANLGGSPFIQQHPHAHGPPPHQQLFNDVLFNIQAQAAYAASVPPPTPVPSTPGAQQETYSVLRVGNGNFLKIYHCPENAMGPLPGETSFTPMHAYNPQPPQQQATTYHHIQQQAPPNLQAAQQQTSSHIPAPPPNSGNSGAPQIFNSYELFSSNTFTQLPTAEMPPVLLLGTTTNNLNSSEPIAIVEEISEELHEQPQHQHQQTILTAPNVTNNWLGNSSSTLPPLYEQLDNTSLHQIQPTEVEYLAQINQEAPQNEILMNAEISEKINDSIPQNIAVPHQPQQQASHHNASIKVQSKEKSSSSNILMKSTSAVLGHKAEIPRQEAPKKRIVAEVKPMRMTYSDVLSKINNQSQQNVSPSAFATNNQHNTTNSNSTIRSQQKTSVKSSTTGDGNANFNSTLTSRRNLEEFSSLRTTTKKSPTHDNKENQQLHNKIVNNKRSVTTVTNNGNSSSLNTNSNTNNTSSNSTNKTSPATTTPKNSVNNFKANNNDLQQQQQQKKRINKNIDIQINGGEYNQRYCIE